MQAFPCMKAEGCSTCVLYGAVPSKDNFYTQILALQRNLSQALNGFWLNGRASEGPGDQIFGRQNDSILYHFVDVIGQEWSLKS